MVEIKPFCGFYYNRGVVGLEEVVAPPHDVISPAGQERYHNSSPYNVIRLILGKQYDSDTSQNNRYSRAAEYLTDWINKKILLHGEEEAIYAYEQTYTVNKRRKKQLGMIALVKLEPFRNKTVLPHEKTLEKSMSDRYKLIRACDANMSLIISLYSDKKGTTNKILKRGAIGEPLVSVENGDGIRHKVWPIYDRTAIERLSDEMRDKRLYIADGHHRYTTALRHSQKTKNPKAKYMMMFLLNMSDHLTVLPAHRVVKNTPPLKFESFMKKLQKFFTVEARAYSPEKRKDSHIFGMYYDGKSYTLKLKKQVNLNKVLKSRASKAWKRLDVTVLHTLILERILKLKDNNSILFTKDKDKAMRFVDSGEYEIAFLLNPTRAEQVREIADNGERMPQKSTYFYPKPLSGLIIRKF